MDLHSLISFGLDKTLKCFVCKNYLSYLPISLCTNNESLCGRCAVPKELISYRDEAFETICQFFKFPCRYLSDGCLEELAPRDMPEHERNCPFRTVQCIIRNPVPCNWQGSLPSLLAHCRTEHTDLILKNGEFQMDLSVEECDSLLEHNNDLLIFTRKFDSTTDILSCALYNHEYAVNTTSCAAQLSVKNGNKTAVLDLKATGFTEVIFTDLPLHCIRGEDNQDSLLCRLNIGNTQSEEHVRRNVFKHIDIQKCSICSKFASDPIYCVRNVHIVCSKCMNKLKGPCSCKMCSPDDFSETALDAVFILVEFPCKYQENGCLKTLKCRQMDLHHNVCSYGSDKCPFFHFERCGWKGLKKDVNDHVLSKHQELLVNSSDDVELSQNTNNTVYKLIQFSNRLFRLSYWMDANGFACCVKKIGSCRADFRYMVNIFNQRGNRKLTKGNFCDGVSYLKHDEIRDYLYVSEAKGNVLKFRVNMYR